MEGSRSGREKKFYTETETETETDRQTDGERKKEQKKRAQKREERESEEKEREREREREREMGSSSWLDSVPLVRAKCILREIVSKEKLRYTQHGFNLDLSCKFL